MQGPYNTKKIHTQENLYIKQAGTEVKRTQYNSYLR